MTYSPTISPTITGEEDHHHGFCVHFDNNGFGEYLGVWEIQGMLFLLSAFFLFLWIREQYQRASDPFWNGQPVIFSLHRNMLILVGLSYFLNTCVFVLVKHNIVPLYFWIILFALADAVIAAATFILLSSGIGRQAIRKAVILGIIWGFFSLAADLFLADYHFIGNSIERSIEALYVILWELFQFIFFAYIWLAPNDGKYFNRRRYPAIYWARFRCIFRFVYSFAIILIFLEYDIGLCLLNGSITLFFAILQCWVLYRSFVMEARWWHGYEDTRSKVWSYSAIYNYCFNKNDDDENIKNAGAGDEKEEIKDSRFLKSNPLRGLELSGEAAIAMTRIVDSMNSSSSLYHSNHSDISSSSSHHNTSNETNEGAEGKGSFLKNRLFCQQKRKSDLSSTSSLHAEVTDLRSDPTDSTTVPTTSNSQVSIYDQMEQIASSPPSSPSTSLTSSSSLTSSMRSKSAPNIKGGAGVNRRASMTKSLRRFSASVQSMISKQTNLNTTNTKVPMINFTRLKISNRMLGCGSSARVFQGSWCGNKCAIKILFTVEITAEEIKRSCLEAKLLHSLQGASENIVKLYGVAVLPPSLCVVLELCSEGSLSDFLYAKQEIEQPRNSIGATMDLFVRKSITNLRNSTSGTRNSTENENGIYNDEDDAGEGGTSQAARASTNIRSTRDYFANIRSSTKNTSPILTSTFVHDLSWSDLLELALGAASGLAALNSVLPGYSHNDIKGANFLVDKSLIENPNINKKKKSKSILKIFQSSTSSSDKSTLDEMDIENQTHHHHQNIQTVNKPYRYIVKLADVEFASQGITPEHLKSFDTPPNWVAPEILSNQSSVSPVTDVFAIGNVFYEIFYRQIPFDGISSDIIRNKICSGILPDFPSGCGSTQQCHRSSTSTSTMNTNDLEILKNNEKPEMLSRIRVQSLITKALATDPDDRPNIFELESELKQEILNYHNSLLM